MTSPFKTLEEFNGAIDGPTGGAIYTFAHTPAINVLALLVAVGIFVWFVISTYSSHHPLPTVDKTLNSLSTFIVAGLLSLVAAEYRPQPQSVETAHEQPQSMVSRRAVRTPLGFLGAIGLAVPGFKKTRMQRKKRLYRKPRSFR